MASKLLSLGGLIVVAGGGLRSGGLGSGGLRGGVLRGRALRREGLKDCGSLTGDGRRVGDWVSKVDDYFGGGDVGLRPWVSPLSVRSFATSAIVRALVFVRANLFC
jgi:hypothetical protein